MWQPPDPGELRHRLLVLEQSVATGIAGSEESYVPGTPPMIVSAKIAPTRGLDVIKDGQTTSQVPIEITVRYRRAITPEKQLQSVSSGRVYIVKSVQNMEERNTWMVLTCVGLGTNG